MAHQQVEAPPADRVAVVTVAARNYLAHVRVLALSLSAQHHGCRLQLALTDEIEWDLDAASEPFDLLTLEDIGVPRRWTFTHNRKELAAAAKPHAVSHLLDRGFEAVLFLDPDTLVLSDLDAVEAQVLRSAITVSPHFLAPPPGPGGDRMQTAVLQAGIYNGGLFGASKTPAARRFLDWWAERLRTDCRHDLAQGLHFDQRWLDFVPSLVENWSFIDDPGCNVGYWRLLGRTMRVRGPFVTVDGVPCRLFHFSGYWPETPQTVTHYFPDLLHPEELGEAATLFERYRQALAAAGVERARQSGYAFGAYRDGRLIPSIARRVYRELGDAGDRAAEFGDPFDVAGESCYRAWLEQPVDSAQPVVTRLWAEIHARQPELARRYPDFLAHDREAFCRAMVTNGVAGFAQPDPHDRDPVARSS
jgi:hypothetical protein